MRNLQKLKYYRQLLRHLYYSEKDALGLYRGTSRPVRLTQSPVTPDENALKGFASTAAVGCQDPEIEVSTFALGSVP